MVNDLAVRSGRRGHDNRLAPPQSELAPPSSACCWEALQCRLGHTDLPHLQPVMKLSLFTCHTLLHPTLLHEPSTKPGYFLTCYAASVQKHMPSHRRYAEVFQCSRLRRLE